MNDAMRVPIRIVFYKEDDVIIAHCLEFDLAGDGANRAEALESLRESIEIQVDATLKEANSLSSLFHPADAVFFEMFAKGRDVAVGSVDLNFKERDFMVINHVDAREYHGSVALA